MESTILQSANISAEEDVRSKKYLIPKRVVWKAGHLHNEEVLLHDRVAQPTLEEKDYMLLKNREGAETGILFDFGIETHGGIQLTAIHCGNNPSVNIRIRFGESAAEAMADIDETSTAANDHAIRDMVVPISALNKMEIGETGFRFVRIDLLGENKELAVSSLKASLIYHDIEYRGTFTSNDERLNKIWKTGAYTVHLNMQEFVWDGIKRDRLVWIGDMHPEISTIQSVFGYHSSVPKSLDLIRDNTPLPGFMNNYPTYSMWWVIIQYDWFFYTGDKRYLQEQRDYLIGLLDLLSSYVKEDGTNHLPNPFIDWPTSSNEEAVRAGVHSILLLAFQKGKKLMEILDEEAQAEKYETVIQQLSAYIPDPKGSKQAGALRVLAGLMEAEKENKHLLSGNLNGISTFLGYYVLLAKAKAGDIQGSLDIIREYWGAMLDLGATTFWEHFDINWIKSAARIDELPKGNQIDVHGTYGDYCYKGYRHSLCHGWASGPTAWLSEYVLGIHITEPGCRKVEINPHLGDLEWAEGAFPTPHGVIKVHHQKREDGSILSEVAAPEEVEVIILPQQ